MNKDHWPLRKTQLHQTATHNSTLSPKASNKEVFSWLSKVNQECFSFSWLCFELVQKICASFSTKCIQNQTLRGRPRFMQFHCLYFEFKWLLVIFSFALIGWCYYHGFFFFAFLFATLNRHPRALQNVRSITDGDILNDRGVNCRAVSVRGITR